MEATDVSEEKNFSIFMLETLGWKVRNQAVFEAYNYSYVEVHFIVDIPLPFIVYKLPPNWRKPDLLLLLLLLLSSSSSSSDLYNILKHVSTHIWVILRAIFYTQ
jgi:hypothetical protein